jgi:hypothetical protein
MFLNYLFHRLRPDMKSMAGIREKKRNRYAYPMSMV